MRLEHKRIMLLLISGFAFLGCLFAVNLTIKRIYELDVNVSKNAFISCFFLIVAHIILVSFLFQFYVRLFSRDKTISIKAAIAATGLSLGAKYVPGKLWGIASKVIVLRNFGFSNYVAVSTIFMEQYNGILVLLAAGICMLYTPLVYLPIALFTVFVIIAISYKYVEKLLPLIGRYIQKDIHSGEPSQCPTFMSIFISGWMCFLSNIPILLAMYYLEEDISVGLPTNQVVFVTGAYLVSVVVGFVVLIAPGGIFVREGVFVALTSNILGVPNSIYIVTVIRIISSITDILFSIYSVIATISEKLDNK